MSLSFSLVCRETKRKIRVGQGHHVPVYERVKVQRLEDRGPRYVDGREIGARLQMNTFYYGEPETMDRLHHFLNEHMGKQLEFVCNEYDLSILDEGWEEFEDPHP